MSDTKKDLRILTLGALGVVFGDIGTSPLYALRECFSGHHPIPLTESNILGILSLIIWSLIGIITIKYLSFVMRAHNKGEGGVLALTALISRKLQNRDTSSINKTVLISLGIFGAALLYADGVITPAISVLGALEGLKIVTPVFNPYIIPGALIILFFLFYFQSHGTGRIGAVFGPLVCIWFISIGCLGLIKIIENPDVLRAFSPHYGVFFFLENGWLGFLCLGSLFLIATGAEALYADMGHFGSPAITRGWLFVAFPGLLLNYLGQGALLIQDPAAIENPFYRMAPAWGLVPLVILATMTSAVASQAIISGAYSLTRQAVQLGYLPRLEINHTSSTQQGQIYVPLVNNFLGLMTIILVLLFKNSSNLAAAYGIAVSSTMLVTTILMYVVSRQVWRWSLLRALSITGTFLIIDIAFFLANALKIWDGGWFPIVLGLAIFTLMTTWFTGRRILGQRLQEKGISWERFQKELHDAPPHRVPGTAVFMTKSNSVTPVPLLHNVRHNKVLHQQVVLLTIETRKVPAVPFEDRVQVDTLGNGFFRVTAYYGFQDEPEVSEILEACREKGVQIVEQELTFFLGREILVPTDRPGMALWREKLFAFMSQNAQGATAFYRIPSERVFEVGIQVEM